MSFNVIMSLMYESVTLNELQPLVQSKSNFEYVAVENNLNRI